MKHIFWVVFAAMALFACDSKKETTDQATPQAEAVAVNTGMVEVPADGIPFVPAIEKNQLPDGVYYCDMGTVHYARAEKGDNKCPLCNMMLTYKKPAGENAEAGAPAEEAPAEESHEGHDHD